jgi:hypothetical protein
MLFTFREGAIQDPGTVEAFRELARLLLAIEILPVYTGAGTPESSIVAGVGSMYLRTDGGASTTLYIKESGTGDTGWVAK